MTAYVLCFVNAMPWPSSYCAYSVPLIKFERKVQRTYQISMVRICLLTKVDTRQRIVTLLDTKRAEAPIREPIPAKLQLLRGVVTVCT